ncbi:hypothetical protein J2X69_002834 [Algoriphagus sp. 4150]|nr:hypothetical protein [Algoriphagus sp. 4150]
MTESIPRHCEGRMTEAISAIINGIAFPTHRDRLYLANTVLELANSERHCNGGTTEAILALVQGLLRTSQ